jgi:hypothetical protein
MTQNPEPTLAYLASCPAQMPQQVQKHRTLALRAG